MMIDRSKGFAEVTGPNGTARLQQGSQLYFLDGSPCHETVAPKKAAVERVEVKTTDETVAPDGPTSTSVTGASEQPDYAKMKFFALRAVCIKRGHTPANKADALAFLASKSPEA